MTAHWGIADPAAAKGTPEKRSPAHFATLSLCLTAGSGCLSLCPSLKLEDMAIKREIDQIGRS